MGKKCKSCSAGSVAGIEDVKYIEMLAATGAALAANKIDNYLVQNADGTPKTTGTFVENPMLKNALFIAAGVGLASYMQDEVSRGAALGLATYGGYGLVTGLMEKYTTPTTSGVYGLMSVPPNNIGSLYPASMPRMVVGNYGVQQPVVNGLSDYKEREMVEVDSVNGGIESGL